MMETYVATGKVTSLEHELRDDAVEGRSSISEALFTSAESSEILGGLWDYVIVKVEVDTTGLLYEGCVLAVDRGMDGFGW